MQSVLRARGSARRSARAEPVADVQVGDTVYANDGLLGRVDHVVAADTATPVFLIVAVGRLVRRRYPVVSCTLVRAVDRHRRRVYVAGRCESLAALTETLPIVA